MSYGNAPPVAGHLRLARGSFTLDAQFEFPGCGITALFGPSGSGKSTLLRAMAGFEKAAAGYLHLGAEVWQDAQYSRPAHQRRVGYVFQEASLFDHLTVQDNLLFGYNRIAKAERQLNPDDIYRRLNLLPLLHRKPAGLSGGERQRVALGRALLTSPQLLLLDEPLSALDKASKEEILPYLQNLQQVLPVPTLYVSHSHDEVARLADYLLLMKQGALVAHGSLEALANRLQSPLAAADEKFSLVPCVVEAHLPDHQLTRLRACNDSFLVPIISDAPGTDVRLRIMARDVSLCLSKPGDTSILNILPVQIQEIAAVHQGQRLLLLATPDNTVTASISELSFQRLGLTQGQHLFAQIKSAALLNPL